MFKKNSNKIVFIIFLIVGTVANFLVLPAITYRQDDFFSSLFGLFLLTTLWFVIGAYYVDMRHEPKKLGAQKE